jgi:hypothetical protein
MTLAELLPLNLRLKSPMPVAENNTALPPIDVNARAGFEVVRSA